MKKILLLFALLSFGIVQAQDRLFTYTYQSDILDRGQKELELWTTLSSGRKNFYRGIDHRLEYEIGLGGNLQTSFYLNYGYSKGIEEANGIQTLNSNTEYSFSNEWKYKLTDPVKNAIGSALYFEYSIAPSSTELEGKFILDKKTGRFTQAFNLVGEYALFKDFIGTDKLTPKSERELKIELNYSIAYKIKKGLNVGMEFFDQNQFSTKSKLENSVLLLGPCLSYSSEGFWVNLSVMPQIADLKGGGLSLNDYEKLQTRLAFSFAF